MKIEFRFGSPGPSEALREHTERRLHCHLSRFADQISAVLVRIGEVTGPKGRVDKRCQVTAKGPRFGAATIDELSADAYAAVDAAVELIGRSVGQEIDRARRNRRNSMFLEAIE